MALFSYLWSFVSSPQETRKRREKSKSLAPTTPTRSRSGDMAMRVHRWREKQKLERQRSEAPTDLEGDTLLELSSVGKTPSAGKTPPPNRYSPSYHLDSTDPDFANDTTLVMDEDEYANECVEPKKHVYDAAAAEERRKNRVADMREIGWSETAIRLWLKLDAKGREPLLPKTWELDFESLPELLFSSVDDEVFIKSDSGNDFRASLSLRKLLSLGGKVRDAMLSPNNRKAPEEVIANSVKEYLKWAYTDANLKVASTSTRQPVDELLNAGFSLPLLVIESGSITVDAEILQRNALRKLAALGENWKQALLQRDTGKYLLSLPTLYTIVATNNTIGFAAYDIDPRDDDGESIEPFLRQVHIFDFRYKGQDVWNALDIAMLIMHVRNEMCYLTDTIQDALGLSESEAEEAGDLDA